MIDKSVELPNKYSKCPVCQSVLDAATIVNEDHPCLPKPGDVSICFVCGTLLEYEEGFFVHTLSEDSLDDIRTNNPDTYLQLILAQKEILKLRKKKTKLRNI